MTEYIAVRSTSATVAIVVAGATMFMGPIQYPARVAAYEVPQVRGSHSDFMEGLVRPASGADFAQRIATIYNSFAERQERLGAEFEDAIFSDLESLYEA